MADRFAHPHHPSPQRFAVRQAEQYFLGAAQATDAGAREMLVSEQEPNDASAVLHQHCGFKPVGIYTEVGRKFGRYWDVQWTERPLKLT